MNKKLLACCLLVWLVGCEEIPTKQNLAEPDYAKLTKNHKYAKLLIDAEKKANPPGRKVLETGREMALLHETVVKGSCWDYANAVYEKAGFPVKGKRKVIVTKKQAATFNLKDLQPGDFLSYINHSFNNIEHSAIFVDWMNFEKKVALMLSYAGQSRNEPARYRPYDLSNVFYVARATIPALSPLTTKKPPSDEDQAESENTETE
jgi:hypothetical protein